MLPLKSNASIDYPENLLWVGLGIGIFYWFAESALHVFILQEGSLLSQILTRDLHEIWKRSFTLSLIFMLSYYAQIRITERKFNDKILKEMEAKYRTLFEEGLIPIFIIDSMGHFIDFNRAALEFFECRREQIVGRSIWDSSIKKDSTLSNDSFLSLVSSMSLEIDYRFHDKIKTLMINLVPFHDDSGHKIIYGIGQDITGRKKMEREIQLAHTELNQIFQTASVGMRLIDREFNVLKINETFSTLSGDTIESAVGRKCYTIFKGGMCHTYNCSLKRILKGEKDFECEVEKIRKDGTPVSCLLTARPFYGPNGELIGIVESFKNINELKRIQEDLRSEHDKLRRILFHRLEGVGIIDADYTIEYLNEPLESELGECKGKKCYRAFRGSHQPCEDCIMQKAFLSGKLERSEFNSASGRIYEQTYTPFSESNGQEKVVVTLRDVTEVKSARAATYRAEQLAALGELAAGVAHEINNPINGIINYAQILINKNSHNSEVNDIASRIRKESNRVALIVESLLSFARRERQYKIPVNLNDMIDDSLTLMMSQMRKEAITVKTDIETNLPPIFAVPQEIQQVFINILSNARYSLNKKYPDSSEDKIIQIKAKFLNSAKTTDYVQISFLDYGTGIPPDIIDKVMNPFFSTKPRGAGTGLGLSITHSIVSEHGGKMVIDSLENEYTSVTIDLPTASNAQITGNQP